MYHVWPKEIQKWAQFNGLSCALLHGAHKMEALHGLKKNIYLINPEGIVWLAKELSKMKHWPFNVLVVDESTKFKTSSSKRFKALKPLLNKFRRRYILTGTVAPNGLIDLFGQIYILDQGNSLGSYITHYRNEYFNSSGYGGYTWTPREDALERISDRIAPLVLRMDAEDYLELPELVNNYIWLDLPDNARKLYRELDDEFISVVGEDVVLAPSAAAAGMKCRQVLNGAIYIDDDHHWREVHTAKLEALEDLVEELEGQPLLVAYEFRHDAERMKKLLGWPIIGWQSDKKDGIIIDQFNKGMLPGVIAHPGSAGIGLNLQEACAHVCWFGLTWNLEHYIQFLLRVLRQGNKAKRVINHHICIRNSRDENVVAALTAKDRTQTQLNKALIRLH